MNSKRSCLRQTTNEFVYGGGRGGSTSVHNLSHGRGFSGLRICEYNTVCCECQVFLVKCAENQGLPGGLREGIVC